MLRRVPGVNRMTEVTISEQMTRMTRRAIAIPFQFLCGGLLPTSSYRDRQRRNGQGKDYCGSDSEHGLQGHVWNIMKSKIKKNNTIRARNARQEAPRKRKESEK